MKGYNFDWLDTVDQNEVQALGKLVSIFLRGMTQEDLAAIEAEDLDNTDC